MKERLFICKKTFPPFVGEMIVDLVVTYSVTTLTKATSQNFLQIKRLNIVEVKNFPTNDYNSVALYCRA